MGSTGPKISLGSCQKNVLDILQLCAVPLDSLFHQRVVHGHVPDDGRCNIPVFNIGLSSKNHLPFGLVDVALDALCMCLRDDATE